MTHHAGFGAHLSNEGSHGYFVLPWGERTRVIDGGVTNKERRDSDIHFSEHISQENHAGILREFQVLCVIHVLVLVEICPSQFAVTGVPSGTGLFVLDKWHG